MNRITELRKKKGISQSKLGEIVGAAQNTVCNWENGSRQPDNETLIKMATYFEVTTDYLLGLTNDDDEKIRLIARHLEQIPEADREQLVKNFEQTIDIYLSAKGLRNKNK